MSKTHQHKEGSLPAKLLQLSVDETMYLQDIPQGNQASRMEARVFTALSRSQALKGRTFTTQRVNIVTSLNLRDLELKPLLGITRTS